MDREHVQSSTKFCEYCGKQNPADAKICGYCGTAFQKIEPISAGASPSASAEKSSAGPGSGNASTRAAESASAAETASAATTVRSSETADYPKDNGRSRKVITYILILISAVLIGISAAVVILVMISNKSLTSTALADVSVVFKAHADYAGLFC